MDVKHSLSQPHKETWSCTQCWHISYRTLIQSKFYNISYAFHLNLQSKMANVKYEFRMFLHLFICFCCIELFHLVEWLHKAQCYNDKMLVWFSRSLVIFCRYDTIAISQYFILKIQWTHHTADEQFPYIFFMLVSLLFSYSFCGKWNFLSPLCLFCVYIYMENIANMRATKTTKHIFC